MEDRFKSVKAASILGIIGNVFLLVIKGLVSVFTGSKAMLADTLNSAGDIISSFMTYIGNKIASKPSDEDHNMGHGKAEYIFSLLISVTMILMAGSSFIESFKSLFNHGSYEFSIWLVIVSIVVIITKFSLYMYTSRLAKKQKNILIDANSKDHRNDCVVTLCTLIASILSIWHIYLFDSIVGMGISIWIIFTGIEIFKNSYDVLMDKCISDESKEKVMKIIKKYPEIKKVIHFNSTPVGYKYQISFTIYVDGNLSTFESHKIADKLEDEIEEKIDEIYLTVIHVNPYENNKKD